MRFGIGLVEADQRHRDGSGIVIARPGVGRFLGFRRPGERVCMRVIVHGTGVSADDEEAFTVAIAAVERAVAVRAGPEAWLGCLDHEVTLVTTKGGRTYTYVTIIGIAESASPPPDQLPPGSHRAVTQIADQGTLT